MQMQQMPLPIALQEWWGALDEALVDADSEEAEAQLARFAKMLCDRCGSDGCNQKYIWLSQCKEAARISDETLRLEVR